jgi:hypothetical protein
MSKKAEMVEHWLLCIGCGTESPRTMVPKSLVDKLKAVGQPMCPSLGRCWPCRQSEILNMVEPEGNA